MKKLIGLIMLSIWLMACATPYQAKGITGGYSDERVSADTFIVKFQGNGHTTMDMANALVLLRACDLTIENGDSYFSIDDERQYTDTGSYTHPGSITTSGSFRHGRYNSFTTYSQPSTSTWETPRTEILIKCYKDKPFGISCFEAIELKRRIRAKHGI